MSDESRRPTGDESRIFWVNSDSDHPSTSRDEKTVLGLSVNDVLPSTTRMPLREQFTKHYVQIREWLTAHAERPGVTLLAMSADALHGAAFLAAKPDLVSTATIGRHSKADLRLKDDASLSLRHVALLLFPYQTPVRGCRYRLLDLRSATAFVDERGKRLRALEADGPAFVRVGNYTLLAFATIGVNALWPDDPDAGWAQIPARLYLDEVETDEKSNQWEAESDKAWEVDDLPSVSSSPTLVHNVAGPKMAVHELVDETETPYGELLITSSRGVATVILGRRAVQSGVLLGRSRRCDAGRVLSDRTISRVHLLIIEIAGVLYAIDTASSNGVFDQDARERASILEPGTSLSLGDVATIEWSAR